MTTDLVSYDYEQAAASAMNALLRDITDEAARLGRRFTDKAPRDSAYKALQNLRARSETTEADINNMDAEAILVFLETQALEKDGWQRSMSATVALLRYAHLMIEKAETTIREQEDRISQLENLSTTDELTGLTNRRGFFQQFMQEADRCEREISHGGLLVLIDLDNFKAINDTYGHLAGDAALRLVARTLADEVRVMDVAARLGGDEFVLLLSNTTKKKAAGRAQQLAWRLNNLSLAWYGNVIPVRASLGLRDYKKGDRPESVFNEADIKLYASKLQRRADVREQGESKA